jgi:Leucine-rich repeat (LRR) protein
VSLNVSHNGLSSLLPALPALPSLKSLVCAGNRLQSLDLGSQAKIIHLSAQGNLLSAWPASIASCVKLTKICLADNKLTDFPDLEVRSQPLDHAS